MNTPALSIHQPEAADATSLSDQAYYRIRELIVTLELAPGSLVSERDLMLRLELGRTPVREALRALARERLIEVYPRRGMFVSSVDVRDLAGLSEVRLTLEPRAARLAAERATDADRARIDDPPEGARARPRQAGRACVDRPRPADSSPHLRVHAQRVPGGDAERVLRPDASHLVPRARPGRPARGRDPRASGAALVDPSRGRRPSGRGDAPARQQASRARSDGVL